MSISEEQYFDLVDRSGVTRRINPWVLRLIIPGYLQMQSV
jgi:hypothetical protein